MNISTRLFRFLPSSLFIAAAVIAALGSTAGSTAGSAYAAKLKPTHTPTPAPGTIPAPSNISVVLLRPDQFQAQVFPYPVNRYVQAQLISGPNTAGMPIVNTIGGFVIFDSLVADSDYVFQVRNYQVGNPPLTSAWVPFSFHTAATFATRPNPPQNLRVTQRTDTTVTVMWDAAPNTTYYYSINSGPLTSSYKDCAPYCSGTDPETKVLARPAPGTSVQFSVIARDTAQNSSLPTTLVVTN